MPDLSLEEFRSKCEQTIGFKLVYSNEYDNAPSLRFLDEHVSDMFDGLALLCIEIGREKPIKCFARVMLLPVFTLEKIVEMTIMNSDDMKLSVKHNTFMANSLDELFSVLKPQLENLAYMINAAFKIEKMPAVCKLREEFNEFKTRQKALNVKIAKTYVIENEAAMR